MGARALARPGDPRPTAGLAPRPRAPPRRHGGRDRRAARHLPRHLRRCVPQRCACTPAARAPRHRRHVLRLQRRRGPRWCALARPGARGRAGSGARHDGLGRATRARRARARGRVAHRLAPASASSVRRGARPRAARVEAAARRRARAAVPLARLSVRRRGPARSRRGRPRRLRGVVRAAGRPRAAVPPRGPADRDLPRRDAGAVPAEDEPVRERLAQASDGASASARTYSITSPRMSSRLRSGVQPTAPVTLSSAGMRWIMSSIPWP